jgi:hypothetical protein
MLNRWWPARLMQVKRRSDVGPNADPHANNWLSYELAQDRQACLLQGGVFRVRTLA